MTHQLLDTGASYKALIKVGALAAWIVALLTLGEVVLFAFYPQPTAIEDWFALVQTNRLLGLLDFWALEVLMYAMFVFVFLALFVLLRQAATSLALTALILGLIGTAVFFATNNPVSMLSLSSQYAAAATDAQRSALLAAGQAVVANTGQRAVGGFNMGLLLVSIAGLLFAVAMLRGGLFSSATGWPGIIANGLSLLDYVRQAITSSPVVALLVILPNALFLIIWFVMVGRRLLALSQDHP